MKDLKTDEPGSFFDSTAFALLIFFMTLVVAIILYITTVILIAISAYYAACLLFWPNYYGVSFTIAAAMKHLIVGLIGLVIADSIYGTIDNK